ncbi:MAG: hypothetical protein KDA91_25090 [Planctomycetaceae bacterium]|nr:hypothetical protein [Planctomycetaceae bacterium]
MNHRTIIWRVSIAAVWIVAVLIVVGAFLYRRANQLEPYREWKSQFPAAMKRPEAYGFEFYIQEFEQPDFVFVKRVYVSGRAAYEEFDYAPGKSRKVLLQPSRGEPTALVIANDGQVTQESFGGGFTSFFGPFNDWRIGETQTSPIWTYLTNAQLLNVVEGYGLSWDQFCSLSARRHDDEQGLLVFEVDVPTPSRHRRAQPTIRVWLDPKRNNRAVRATAGFRGEPPVWVNYVVSWQETPDGQEVPWEVSFSYANQERRVRIVNPTFGPISQDQFDPNKIAKKARQ